MLSTELWIALIIVGIIAGLLLLFPLLLIGSALIEKRRLLMLTPVEDDRASRAMARNAAPLELAARAGFRWLGVYSDREGMIEGILALLLSEDAGTLMVRSCRAELSTRFITPLLDGRWVVTADFGGEDDLSGLYMQAMLPTDPFPHVYSYHLQRVAELSRDTPAVTFDAATLLEEILLQEQTRVQMLIDRGLARRLFGPDDRWKYTLTGALRIAAAGLRRMIELPRVNRLAEARKKAATDVGLAASTRS
jgi:hypothetical protein